MIHPITKSSQTRRSALKAGHRIKKAVEKVKKQKKNQKERGKIGARLRSMIIERDHGKCVLCGAKPAKNNAVALVVDHIVPVAQGGRSTEENLATLCQPCNAGKGARIIDILKAIGHALK